MDYMSILSSLICSESIYGCWPEEQTHTEALPEFLLP